MTMILQLLVAAVAVSQTVAGYPEYKQNATALKEASAIMHLNLLSMEGNIPLLTDFRRHYAEIVHVIYYHGLLSSGGVTEDNYQQLLNSSAPEAIKNPEIVIDEIKYLFAQVDNNTSELIDLIHACIQSDGICNALIDDTVRQNIDQYGPQARVLFAAGKVANELKKRNSKFEEASKNLAAHPYVILTPQDLKDINDALMYLLTILLTPPV